VPPLCPFLFFPPPLLNASSAKCIRETTPNLSFPQNAFFSASPPLKPCAPPCLCLESKLVAPPGPLLPVFLSYLFLSSYCPLDRKPDCLYKMKRFPSAFLFPFPFFHFFSFFFRCSCIFKDSCWSVFLFLPLSRRRSPPFFPPLRISFFTGGSLPSPLEAPLFCLCGSLGDIH